MSLQEVILQKYFNDAPPLKELIDSKLSLILLNSHFSIGDPVPHVPAMVDIGGYHIEEPKTLPKVLQYKIIFIVEHISSIQFHLQNY